MTACRHRPKFLVVGLIVAQAVPAPARLADAVAVFELVAVKVAVRTPEPGETDRHRAGAGNQRDAIARVVVHDEVGGRPRRDTADRRGDLSTLPR
jgi:hypothetical protein